MWYLVDTLSRPPLARHLWWRASMLNREAARLLEGPLDARSRRRLVVCLEAGTACWQMFRWNLPAPPWATLKADLRRQRRLSVGLEAMDPELLVGLRRHAGSRGDARTLQRLAREAARQEETRGRNPAWRHRQRHALQVLLDRQLAWLEAWRAAPDVEEAKLRAALTRLYRKARQTLERDAAAGGTRRRLGHLVRIEELLGVARGPRSDGGPGPAYQRRALYEALQESWQLQRLIDEPPRSLESCKDGRRIRRLVSSRQAELAAQIAALRGSAMAANPEVYAAELPWQVFRGLIDWGTEVDG